MNTRKRLFVGLLLLAIMFTLVLGVVACKPQQEPPKFTPQGEEALYYQDKPNGECSVELKNGQFVWQVGGMKTGTYAYDKASKALVLTFADGKTQNATLDTAKGELSFRYGDENYRMIKKISFKVTFNTDGGSAIADQTVVNGRLLSKPSDPTKTNHFFTGWYKDAQFKVPFNFSTETITADTTIYARFIEESDGAGEFTVKLVNGTEVLSTPKTNNGYLYNLPELEETGKVFLGWWYSDSNDAQKLTAKYVDGKQILENTTLYAVWQGAKTVISVFDDKVEWTPVENVAFYTYSVKHVEDGTVIAESQSVATSFDIDFNLEDPGEYEITISYQGNVVTAYYNNKTLARVSLFEVVGNDLVFNKVPNATEYTITVKCGNPNHNHVDEALDLSSTYNFANCSIGANGYEFTVTASARGYVSSVSETFVYNRFIDDVTGLGRDTATDVITWNEVEGAEYYLVKITANGEVVSETVFTNSIFVGDYKGNVTVEVTPYAFGYNANAKTLTYTNNRLATPANIKVNGDVITWDAVAGATGYIVKINGVEREVPSNTFTMSDSYYEPGQTEYVISVQAKAGVRENYSIFSVPFTAKLGVMGNISYSNNVLSWDAVFGASKYIITINKGEESQVVINVEDGSLFAVITWPRANENKIEVACVDKNGNVSAPVSTTVFTYTIHFSAGSVKVNSIYKAVGDEYTLPTPQGEGQEFDGWYDRADVNNGNLVNNKGVMKAEDFTVYAAWTTEKYTVTLELSGVGFFEGEDTGSVSFGRKYQLPVPTSDDATKVFLGYRTEPNGGGEQCTGPNGESLAVWDKQGGKTLYADWAEVLSFEVVYNPTTKAKDSLKVKPGRGIDYVSEITIPQEYYGTFTYTDDYKDDDGTIKQKEFTETKAWKVYSIEQNAFQNCRYLIKVNIPSTIGYVAGISDGATYNNSGAAFSGCTRLEALFVYDVTDPTKEVGYSDQVRYWSCEGVLYVNDEANDETEVLHYPYNKPESVYSMPEGVTNIPQYTFYDAGFTTVYLPASISRVNRLAFYNCKKLTSIIFREPDQGQMASPTLVIDAGNSNNAAIVDCPKLISVTFPLRLQSFDSTSIYDCPALTTILIGELENGTGEKYSSIAIKHNGAIVGSIITDKTKTEVIYIPRGFTGVPMTNAQGMEIGRQLVIPEDAGVEIIRSNAIGDAQSAANACLFTSVVIPRSVRMIESYAFANCTSLTEIIFKGEAEDRDLTIESYAFLNCSLLTALNLPANLRVVEKYAFSGATLITDVRVNVERSTIDYQMGAFATETQMGDAFYIRNLYIGKGCPEMAIGSVFGSTVLESINVEPGNNFFKSTEDGILLNNAGTRILFFPLAKGGSYAIPDSVVEIDPATFRDRIYLTEVIIHANVAIIGEEAFKGCTALTKVTFVGGNTVELTIGAGAFRDCTSLTSVDIPARTVAIGDHAFRNNTILSSITFEESTSTKPLTIGAYAFANVGVDATARLETITLPNRVKVIGSLAFYNDVYLKTINIPASVEKMGFYEEREVDVYGANGKLTGQMKDVLIVMDVFYGCVRLERIEIASGNKYYADVDGILYSKEYASVQVSNFAILPNGDVEFTYTLRSEKYFDYTDGTIKALLYCPAGASGDNGKVIVPNTIMAICYGAFANNGNTEYVLASQGVKEISFNGQIENQNNNDFYIDNQAFMQCHKLTKVELPLGLKRIGSQMFYNCYNLEEIVVPYTVENVEKQAFYSCTKLHKVEFVEAPAGADRVFNMDGGWTITTQTKDLDANCGVFYNCVALKTLTLPRGITRIYPYTFYGSYIEELVLPATLLSIEHHGCARMTYLNRVTFPNGLEGQMVISNHAFEYSYSLEHIDLPEGITAIGAYAFANTNIVNITIPSTVVEIGKNYEKPVMALSTIFGNTPNLETVTFARGCSITEIPANCFTNKGKLTQVNNIPATVTKIGDNAFSLTPALTSITFATNALGTCSLQEIGKRAFVQSGITELILPESSASELILGAGLFAQCTQLKRIYLPKNVLKLVDVFDELPALENITINPQNPNFEVYGDSKLPVVVSKTGNNIEVAYRKIVGSVVIPSGFTTISQSAFKGQDQITSLTIPSSIRTINKGAFQNCKALQQVTFEGSPSLTAIGDYAFANTIALTGINFPTATTFVQIGASAFAGSGLRNVEVPSSVKTIGNNAFADTFQMQRITFKNVSGTYTYGNALLLRSAVVEVSFANSSDNINDNASNLSMCSSWFKECANLTTVTNWPLTTVPNDTFNGCVSLRSFTLKPATTKIGLRAFRNTNISSINLELTNDALTEIGSQAFANTKLTTVTIPAKVTTIGNGAFMNCYELTTVTLKSSSARAQEIGSNAFYNCTNLTTFALPSSNGSITIGEGIFKNSGITSFNAGSKITNLPKSAFENCINLQEVTLNMAMTSVGDNAFAGCTALKTMNLANIGGATNPATGKVSLATIGVRAFYGCTSLTTLTGLNYIKQVGQEAFIGTKITSFTITANLTKIDHYAFKDCTTLTDVDFSNGTGMTFIGKYAFYNTGISEIKLGNKITNLGSRYDTEFYAFANCQNLTSVQLGSKLVKIGAYVFYNCPNLTTVTGMDRLQVIGNYAFAKTGLTKVEFGTKLKKDTVIQIVENIEYPLGEGIFSDCKSLTSVKININTNWQTIGAYYRHRVAEKGIFENCTALTTVTASAGFKAIGPRTFAGCTALTSLSFLNNNSTSIADIMEGAFEGSGLTAVNLSSFTLLTQVGARAFANCSSIETIELGTTVSAIGNEAFINVEKVTELTIPNTITKVGMGAFRGMAGVETLNIGSGLTTVGGAAFAGMKSLTTINNSSAKFSLGSKGELIQKVDGKDVVLMIPASYTGVYVFANGTVPGESCFADATGLTGVQLPANTTVITRRMFAEYQGTILVLPNTIEKIEDYAFEKSLIEEIIIPDSVTEIGIGIFAQTHNLKKVTFGANVSQIYTDMDNVVGMFDDSSVEEVVINSTNMLFVDELGNPANDSRMFQRTNNLKRVKLANGATTLYPGMFYNVNAEFTVAVPDTVTVFPQRVFVDCFGSKITINVPASLTTIEENFFKDTTYDKDGGTSQDRPYLQNFRLSSTVTTIANNAFEGVHFGEFDWGDSYNLTTLGDYTFRGAQFDQEVMTMSPAITKTGRSTFEYTIMNKFVFPSTWAEYFTLTKDAGNTSGNINDQYYVTNTFKGAIIQVLEFEEGIIQLDHPDTKNGQPHHSMLCYAEIGKLILPSSLKHLAEFAFAHLKTDTIVLPQGLETMGARAFSNSTINKVYWPSSIKSKSSTNTSTMFNKSNSMMEVHFEATEEEVVSFFTQDGWHTYIKDNIVSFFGFNWDEVPQM